VRVDLDEIEKACAAALARSPGDVAHDLAHVQRVVANARRLAASEGARLAVVVPAAWLHDCVVEPKDSPRRGQASRLAAEQAVAWLESWGFPSELLAETAHAIEAHSFSAAIPPRTLEARVVQDADRLDALGAVGLARCLMLGGALGRPLYVPADPFCTARAPDDARSTVDHFYTKLLLVENRMQTAAGRREARDRTEYLRQFLAVLGREIDGG
jgi:uncharacterized protein